MRSGLVGRVVLCVLGGVFAFGTMTAPVAAESDDDAPPADPEAIAARVELFMNEFSNADLDGDGNADFADTDGDGIPDIPEGEPGDLDLRPGDGRFGTLVVEQIEESGEIYISDSEGSALIGDCSGMAISYDEDGSMVDWAIGVGSSEGGGPTGQLIDLYPPEDLGKRAFIKSHRAPDDVDTSGADPVGATDDPPPPQQQPPPPPPPPTAAAPDPPTADDGAGSGDD